MSERLMPEKSAAWLEAECLRRCRLLVLSRHLEAVKIERTKPAGGGPNWPNDSIAEASMKMRSAVFRIITVFFTIN